MTKQNRNPKSKKNDSNSGCTNPAKEENSNKPENVRGTRRGRGRGRGRGRRNAVENEDSSSETNSEINGSNITNITAGTSKDGSSKTKSKRKGSSEAGISSDPTMEVIQKDQCTSDTGLTTTKDTSPQELNLSKSQKLIPMKQRRNMKSLQQDEMLKLLYNKSDSTSITTTATTTTTTTTTTTICRTTAPAAIITTTSTITSTTTTTTPLGTVAVDRMGLSKMHKNE